MRDRIRVERTYEASIDDVWELWTTKEGFESWWGPEGFRVDVHALEARPGGALHYDMIAVGAEQVAAMERSGAPLSHETRGTFTAVVPMRRLEITHIIDFLPGVEPYDNVIEVELVAEGTRVRMVVLLSPYHDPAFTQMAQQGFESQLTKGPAALDARRARRTEAR